MKRTTDISNIKAFTKDGTEMGKVDKLQIVIQRMKHGSIPWLVTVKNQQTVN